MNRNSSTYTDLEQKNLVCAHRAHELKPARSGSRTFHAKTQTFWFASGHAQRLRVVVVVHSQFVSRFFFSFFFFAFENIHACTCVHRSSHHRVTGTAGGSLESPTYRTYLLVIGVTYSLYEKMFFLSCFLSRDDIGSRMDRYPIIIRSWWKHKDRHRWRQPNCLRSPCNPTKKDIVLHRFLVGSTSQRCQSWCTVRARFDLFVFVLLQQNQCPISVEVRVNLSNSTTITKRWLVTHVGT